MSGWTPAGPFQAATKKHRGQPRLGPDNSLENYTAGRPFPEEEIDCKGRHFIDMGRLTQGR